MPHSVHGPRKRAGRSWELDDDAVGQRVLSDERWYGPRDRVRLRGAAVPVQARVPRQRLRRALAITHTPRVVTTGARLMSTGTKAPLRCFACSVSPSPMGRMCGSSI